ncbi:MAG: iron-containing alcohol dehydrogenase [Alphaproteobacteria bacterium]
MADYAHLTNLWRYPTLIRFGVGRIQELPEVCKDLGIRHPLLVTDPGLAGLPMVKEAIAANNAAGVTTILFSDIKGNPTGKNLMDGVAAFEKNACDGVIAFGGGSAMDCGKTIAFMAGQHAVGHPNPWQDYAVFGPGMKVAKKDKVAPIIAIPTTAGTGSEVGRAAVITDEVTHAKRIILYSYMMPATVIADPALTVGLPPHITAATGMDALAHCFEAYSAKDFHPMADGIAVEGMRLIKEWLPRAVKDGKDLEARAHMMAAASMGAAAFNKGLGAIHALSHPVGALFDTHHGLTNAVFMPYVMAFNKTAIEDKMVRLAGYLGIEPRSYRGIMDWVLALRQEFNIPHTTKELGVPVDRLEEIAKLAADDPCAPENPVPCGPKEMRVMLDASYTGQL